MEQLQVSRQMRYIVHGLGIDPEKVPNPMTRINDLDIIVFCGSPAAGKSTFYWMCLRPLGYERVNQDILKTVCFAFKR